jgi:hypothetical protein
VEPWIQAHGIVFMAKPPTATAKASDTPMGVISDTPVGFARACSGDAHLSAAACAQHAHAHAHAQAQTPHLQF